MLHVDRDSLVKKMKGVCMTLLIVIFSFSGFLYAIEPSSQEYCDKEAVEILARFTEKDTATRYYGGCVLGGILLNVKMTDA